MLTPGRKGTISTYYFEGEGMEHRIVSPYHRTVTFYLTFYPRTFARVQRGFSRITRWRESCSEQIGGYRINILPSFVKLIPLQNCLPWKMSYTMTGAP